MVKHINIVAIVLEIFLWPTCTLTLLVLIVSAIVGHFRRSSISEGGFFDGLDNYPATSESGKYFSAEKQSYCLDGSDDNGSHVFATQSMV